MVFPDPVSPTIMITWLFSIKVISYLRYLKIGRDYLVSCIGVFFIFIF